MRTIITGTGSYLPKKIISNDDLSKNLDTSDEWINTRTGIRQRHVADFKDSETCSKMATFAAQNALEMAKLRPTDLDLIITATVTADYRVPSAACLVQENLGATHVPAFDISAACAGSIYALSIADSFIKSGRYKNILVTASEVLSSATNWEDRNTAILFGDGASAAVLGKSDGETGFIDFNLYADGEQNQLICIPAGGSKHPTDDGAMKNRTDKIAMNGRETFKFAVRAMCDAVEKILDENKVKASEIKFAVPHQANLRIIEAIAKRLDLPMDRFLVNLDLCANTSAASLLLAYDQAQRNKRFQKDDLILMLAIGAGFAWGASLYRV